MRAALICLSLVATNPATHALPAQEEPARSGPFVRFGVGLGNASSHDTYGSHADKTGVLGGVHVGIGSRRLQALVEAHWQPFKLPVPFRDDAVRLVYLLGSLQWFPGRQAYVRAGLGLAHGSWSGPAGRRTENYPAAGLSFGVEIRTLGRWLAYEAWWRGATGLCFENCSFAGTRVLGAQALVPFY